MSRRLMAALVVLSAACAAEHSSSDVSAPSGGAGLVEASAVRLVSLDQQGDPRPAFARRKVSGAREVTSFAWVVPVRNDSSTAEEVSVTLRFFDRGGNDVQRLVRRLTLESGERRELTGEWLALPSEAFRIAGVEVTSVLGDERVLFSGTAVEVVDNQIEN